MAIADVVKLYDAADSYNVRSQIVNVLGNRKEPEATDKLIDIVKNGNGDESPHAGDQRAPAEERPAGHATPDRHPRREIRQTMIRATHIAAAALLAAAGQTLQGQTQQSQSIANRVSSAPDGRVQFTFAARPGICGNGRSYIQTGPNSISGSISYNGNFYGSYNDAVRIDPCVAGPVRVVIDRADKQPLSIQTYVGPADTTLRGVTDLGHMRSQDAADYLLSLAGSVDGRAGRDALFPAMLADSANTAAALVTIAKNTRAPARDAPQRAVVHGSLDRRHADDSDQRHRSDSRHRPRRDRQPVGPPAGAVRARTPRPRRRHSAARPAVAADAEQLAGEGVDVRRSPAPATRARVSICARRCVAPICPTKCSPSRSASLGQDYATAQDAALLRERLPDAQDRPLARSRVLRARRDGRLGEHEVDGRRMAQNGNESLTMRRRALDAASRAGAPIAEMVRLYDTTTDPNMKETLIGIYIRNGETAGDRQAAHDREGRGESLAAQAHRSRDWEARKTRGSSRRFRISSFAEA